MRLRALKIGLRLAAGFAVVLSMLLINLFISTTAISRGGKQLAQSLEIAREKTERASDMKIALLEAGISIRNIGLQSDVKEMQKMKIW